MAVEFDDGLCSQGEAVAVITPDTAAKGVQASRCAMSCEKTKLPVYIQEAELSVGGWKSQHGRQPRPCSSR